MPYYVVAKIWYAAIGLVHTGEPWTMCRWLSALLASACVGLLATWVASRHRLLGIVAAGVLVALPGFDRYTQEARPYAAMVLVVGAVVPARRRSAATGPPLRGAASWRSRWSTRSRSSRWWRRIVAECTLR